MRYWIIYLTETDGEIEMWPCRSGKDINEFITLMKLHREDYSIIEGLKLKSFDNVSFDHKRLKEIK